MKKITKKVKQEVLKELRKPNPNLRLIEDIILEYEFPETTGIMGSEHPIVKVSYGNVLAFEENLVALETLDESEVYYYGVQDLIKLFGV